MMAAQPKALAPCLGKIATALNLDVAQLLGGLREAHKANRAAHRARYGFLS